MNLNQVAINLYTLREYCKDIKSIKQTLKMVKEIGYTSVQVSSLGIEDPYVIKELTENEGLYICATHETPKDILENPSEVLQRLKIYQTKHTVFPHPGNISIDSKSDWIKLANSLNKVGEFFYNNGITLSYHNHEMEFSKIDDEIIFNIILDNSCSSFLKVELDTFWVHKGGYNPMSWCNYLKNRLPLLHMKDYIISLNREVCFGEIGKGSFDWLEIIKIAKLSNCEWFIVEQDICEIDPFYSIHISLEYIKNNFLI